MGAEVVSDVTFGPVKLSDLQRILSNIIHYAAATQMGDNNARKDQIKKFMEYNLLKMKEKYVKAVFSLASKTPPSVIFVDECVGSKDAYTGEEMNELRDLWAAYFMENHL